MPCTSLFWWLLELGRVPASHYRDAEAALCRWQASAAHPAGTLCSPHRTQEALKSGHFINVLSILMRLQRICNHPGLIEPRCPSSSYVAAALQYWSASLILRALERDFWKVSVQELIAVAALTQACGRLPCVSTACALSGFACAGLPLEWDWNPLPSYIWLLSCTPFSECTLLGVSTRTYFWSLGAIHSCGGPCLLALPQLMGCCEWCYPEYFRQG